MRCAALSSLRELSCSGLNERVSDVLLATHAHAVAEWLQDVEPEMRLSAIEFLEVRVHCLFTLDLICVTGGGRGGSRFQHCRPHLAVFAR